jgi:hypothetical protein
MEDGLARCHDAVIAACDVSFAIFHAVDVCNAVYTSRAV